MRVIHGSCIVCQVYISRYGHDSRGRDTFTPNDMNTTTRAHTVDNCSIIGYHARARTGGRAERGRISATSATNRVFALVERLNVADIAGTLTDKFIYVGTL